MPPSPPLIYVLSHVMRKPVYAICEQQRRRSAFVFRCLNRKIPLGSISEMSSLYLASMAAQAGLSLPWWETPKTDFLVTKLYDGFTFSCSTSCCQRRLQSSGRGSWSLCLSCIGLLAMHTLICHFSLPPGARDWLRLLLVAPPGLFCLPF